MENMTNLEDSFAESIKQRTTKVGVVGMGYVGLPLALAFCENGFSVVGFDVDERKVEKLRAGEGYIQHLGTERLAEAAKKGQLDATADFDRLAEVDAILVAVPTPLTKQREPDMRYIVSTAEQIRDRLRRGHLIVLE